MFNHAEAEFTVKAGDRIAQLVCERIAHPEIQVQWGSAVHLVHWVSLVMSSEVKLGLVLTPWPRSWRVWKPRSGARGASGPRGPSEGEGGRYYMETLRL